MDADQIRPTVLALLREVAPETDTGALDAARPLREQVELDSMDWLNFVEAVGERLGIVLPLDDWGPATTLDALVAAAAAARAGQPRPAAVPSAHTRRLADGTEVVVRPIRADDAPLEAAFVRRLSAESRYKRFMSSLSELPPHKLRYFTDVDQVDHIAWVAVTRVDGADVLVGVARCIVEAGGDDGEFALVVDDAHQGTGLAGVLMRTLMQAARARGLPRMNGWVLTSNRPMLRLARQLGFAVRREGGDPQVMHVVREL